MGCVISQGEGRECGTWRVSWVLAGGTDRACGRLDGVPEKRRLGRDSTVPALVWTSWGES